jgi:hypothetical protein
MEAGLELLGSIPTSDRLVWCADMDSAIAVSALVHAGSFTRPAAAAHFAQVNNGRANPTSGIESFFLFCEGHTPNEGLGP